MQSTSNLSNLPNLGMLGRSQAGWAKLCSHLRPACISDHRGVKQRENLQYNFLENVVSPKSCPCSGKNLPTVVLKSLDQHSIRVTNSILTPTVSRGKLRSVEDKKIFLLKGAMLPCRAFLLFFFNRWQKTIRYQKWILLIL